MIHMHSSALKEFLSFENIIPYPLFWPVAQQTDAVAAPDKGAGELAHTIAEQEKKEVIYIEKQRPEKEMVSVVSIDGDANNRSILIVDDMISTGNTVVKATELLQAHGATKVRIMATHNLMTHESIERIQASSIEKVYVTNTIVSDVESEKLEISDIGPFIKEIIKKEY